MDSEGFKFTFYSKPFDLKSAKSTEPAQRTLNSARKQNLNRPILAQIVNHHSNCKSARPSTQKNPRIFLNTRPESECKKAIGNSQEMVKSKSYLSNFTAKENLEPLTKRIPKSCNALKLVPVLHLFKKTRQGDILGKSMKLRINSKGTCL